jgi:hypothetical protein
MDLGHCQGWIMHGKCEFVSWELYPLRHWIAEPIEMRWHSEKMVKRMLASRGPFLPPDNPRSKYAGRSRVYQDGSVFKPERFAETAPPEIKAWHDQDAINKKPAPAPEQKGAENTMPQIRETYIQTGPKKTGPSFFPPMQPKQPMQPMQNKQNKQPMQPKTAKSPQVPSGKSRRWDEVDSDEERDCMSIAARVQAAEAKRQAHTNAWAAEQQRMVSDARKGAVKRGEGEGEEEEEEREEKRKQMGGSWRG